MKISEDFIEVMNRKFSPMVMTLEPVIDRARLKIAMDIQVSVYVWVEHLSKKDILGVLRLVRAYSLLKAVTPSAVIFLNSETSESSKFLMHVCKSWAKTEIKIAALMSGAVAVDTIGLDKTLKLWASKNKKRTPKLSTTDEPFDRSHSRRYSNIFAYLIPGASIDSLCTLRFLKAKEFAEKMFTDPNFELVSTFFTLDSNEQLTLDEYFRKRNGSFDTYNKAVNLDAIMTTLILLKTDSKEWVLSLTREEIVEFSKRFATSGFDEKLPLDLIISRMRKMTLDPSSLAQDISMHHLITGGSSKKFTSDRTVSTLHTLILESSTPEEYTSQMILSGSYDKVLGIGVPNAILENTPASAMLVEISIQKGLEKAIELLQVTNSIWFSPRENRINRPRRESDHLATTLLLKEILEADDDFPVEWTVFASEHVDASREKVDSRGI